MGAVLRLDMSRVWRRMPSTSTNGQLHTSAMEQRLGWQEWYESEWLLLNADRWLRRRVPVRHLKQRRVGRLLRLRGVLLG